MSIPQEWINAGAEAINGEEATATYGYYGASWRVDAEHAPDLTREVLTAVLPLIREAIAAEIEEERCRHCSDLDCIDDDSHVGLTIAAAIARGADR